MSASHQAYRGQLFYFVDDPASAGASAWRHHPEGLLWIRDGYVEAAGEAAELLPRLPLGTPVTDYPHHLLFPGFVDTHIHYPQIEMIAAYGEQLLEWLNQYTFPVERRFADEAYARSIARVFLDELLRNGTTTAMVFASVHPESVDAFLNEARERRLRMIAGKVMMNRNAPAELRDSDELGYCQSRALIERWHGVARLQYAITPRFAPTSTPEQLARAGQLLREYPGVYLQTHLAENLAECAWVRELFPQAKDYLDVYDRAGLLSERSVFAHGIHLDDDACARLAASGSRVAHCPSSNLFMGSGLFPLERLAGHGIKIAMGTDVGGGTSFSMFKTLADAYKIQQLRGQSLDPLRALYLATLGGARALALEHAIGSFLPGREADFVALDLHATPLLRFRTERCRTLKETLFVLNTLGDDRVIETTWVMGNVAHRRDG